MRDEDIHPPNGEPAPTGPYAASIEAKLAGSRRALSSRQAAEMIGVSAATLATYRSRGGACSPPYRRRGSRVFYLLEDIEAWLVSRPVFRSIPEERETGASA